MPSFQEPSLRKQKQQKHGTVPSAREAETFPQLLLGLGELCPFHCSHLHVRALSRNLRV